MEAHVELVWGSGPPCPFSKPQLLDQLQIHMLHACSSIRYLHTAKQHSHGAVCLQQAPQMAWHIGKAMHGCRKRSVLQRQAAPLT